MGHRRDDPESRCRRRSKVRTAISRASGRFLLEYTPGDSVVDEDLVEPRRSSRMRSVSSRRYRRRRGSRNTADYLERTCPMSRCARRVEQAPAPSARVGLLSAVGDLHAWQIGQPLTNSGKVSGVDLITPFVVVSWKPAGEQAPPRRTVVVARSPVTRMTGSTAFSLASSTDREAFLRFLMLLLALAEGRRRRSGARSADGRSEPVVGRQRGVARVLVNALARTQRRWTTSPTLLNDSVIPKTDARCCRRLGRALGTIAGRARTSTASAEQAEAPRTASKDFSTQHRRLCPSTVLRRRLARIASGCRRSRNGQDMVRAELSRAQSNSANSIRRSNGSTCCTSAPIKEIARQNLAKLTVEGAGSKPFNTPDHTSGQRTGRPRREPAPGEKTINFISFTPGTSFERRAQGDSSPSEHCCM